MISLKASMTCRSKSYVCLAMRSAVFIKFLPARGAQCRLYVKRGHSGIVNPSRNRKSGTGNPPPTAGAPALDPTGGGLGEKEHKLPRPQPTQSPASHGRSYAAQV